MYPEQLSQIVTNISALHSVSAEALEAVVAKYPYFAVGHVLLLKKYQLTDPTAFDRYLPIVAMHVADRKRLRAFIDAPIPLPEAEEQAVAQPDITETMVVEEPTAEADNQATNKPELPVDAPEETPESLPDATADEALSDETQVVKEPIEASTAGTEEVASTEDEANPDREQQAAGEPVADSDPADKEVHSFSDWLKRFANKKTSEPTTAADTPTSDLLTDPSAAGEAFMARQLKTDTLVNDALITGNNPVAPDELEAVEGLAKKSVEMGDELVTETLAKIFLAQGNHAKALETYEKLRLKYPEKSHYFASQIQKLQENNQ